MIHERAISTILAHAADGGLPPSAIAWLRPRLVALDPPLTRKGRLKYFARTTLDQTGRYTIAILLSFAAAHRRHSGRQPPLPAFSPRQGRRRAVEDAPGVLRHQRGRRPLLGRGRAG